MKSLSTLFVLVLLSTVGFAQTNVDRLVQAFDSISLERIDNWKLSPNLSSFVPADDPTKLVFDDSSWDNLSINQ